MSSVSTRTIDRRLNGTVSKVTTEYRNRPGQPASEGTRFQGVLVPLWASIPLAAAAGAILDAGFPDRGWWVLAPVGVLLMLIALVGRGPWAGGLVGTVAAFSFWLIHISWLTLYLGPVPWLALSALQGILFGIGLFLISVVLRLGPRVWLSALAVQLMRETQLRPSARWGIAIGAIAVLTVVPPWPIAQTGATTLAAVQGASDAGLFAQYKPGQILNDHASTTLPLIGQDVDFVVWPENLSDIDPTRSGDAAQLTDEISRNMNAPLITGTITLRDGQYYNSSLLWKAGQGAVALYDKVHPVPFAEYMPDRAFWRLFAPDLVDLVSRDYTIGTLNNVFDINGILAGIAICFDITDDRLLSEMIDAEAEIILAQSNNADFGYTDESVQQLAIARLRAIETGRTVVNISTVGSSAIITADGRTVDSLQAWRPGAMVQTVPLSDTVTPAMAVGRALGIFLSGLGLAGLTLCIANRPAKSFRR